MNNKVLRCLWQVGAELGEGPLWLAEEQRLYFVDVKKQQIYRCAADGGQRHSWHAPQQIGFIAPHSPGNFICGLQDGLAHFSLSTESFIPFQAMEPALPHNRLNDGHVDLAGGLWFGTMDDHETEATGALYSLDLAGTVRRHDSGYIISNGPALSPDGQILYHTDTVTRRIFAFDVDADRNLHNRRVLLTTAGSGHPDGMAVDAAGDLWVAMFGGWRIDRYSSSGELRASIAFPCANITKLCWGGEALGSIFVTTARKGLTAAQLLQQPLAGSLFALDTDVAGLPQQRCLVNLP